MECYNIQYLKLRPKTDPNIISYNDYGEETSKTHTALPPTNTHMHTHGTWIQNTTLFHITQNEK